MVETNTIIQFGDIGYKTILFLMSMGSLISIFFFAIYGFISVKYNKDKIFWILFLSTITSIAFIFLIAYKPEMLQYWFELIFNSN